MPEFLTIFNLDTDDNLWRWQRACTLCLGSLDVESITRALPAHVSDEFANIEMMTQTRYDSSPRKVQQVVLFAGIDALASEPTFFQVRKETSINVVMENYLHYLEGRKRLLATEKKSLLEPITKVIHKLKEAHMTYVNREGGLSDMSKALESWYATLPGMFDRHVQRLIERFVVFTFCGSKYDLVLMSGPLATAATKMEPRGRLAMDRNGNKIRSLTIKGKKNALSGTQFRDLVDMVDKTVSLDSFSKMCGCNFQKAKCSFKQLDCFEALDRPEFDWTREAWRNDLTGECPSLEDIDEARQVFIREGCRSIGDYLRHYLALDVK